MVVVTVGGESYYMNPKMKEKWDSIKDGKLQKKDEDRVYIVDGRERSGKSLFTLQQAAYIDPTIIKDLSRITFSPEKTLDAIRNTKSTEKETKVIIFDEAFRGLSSKAAISKVNKRIVQALMEMGQNNLVLFLVSPSFFLLELYAAMLRSEALFHIVKKKGETRRSFRVFNYQKKAMLYKIGLKKGWSYNMHTKFKDTFPGKYPGGKNFKRKYIAKKAQELREIGDPTKKTFSREEEKLFIQKFLENADKMEKKIPQIQLARLFSKTPNTLRAYTRVITPKNT